MRSESARLVPVKHRGATMKGSTTILHLHRLLWISRLRIPRPSPTTLLITLGVGQEIFRPLHASVLAKEGILNACSTRVTPKTTAGTLTRNPPRELLLIQVKKSVANALRYQHIASFNP